MLSRVWGLPTCWSLSLRCKGIGSFRRSWALSHWTTRLGTMDWLENLHGKPGISHEIWRCPVKFPVKTNPLIEKTRTVEHSSWWHPGIWSDGKNGTYSPVGITLNPGKWENGCHFWAPLPWKTLEPLSAVQKLQMGAAQTTRAAGWPATWPQKVTMPCEDRTENHQHSGNDVGCSKCFSTSC